MIYFLTFGAGRSEFLAAAARLRLEAQKTGVFTEVLVMSEADLRADESFWSQHGAFIEGNPRGFGYWIWKPYIILKVLRRIAEGDMLIYADAGCEFDTRFAGNIPRLGPILARKKILGMLGPSNDITHSKASVCSALGLIDAQRRRLGHIQAGIIYMRKCEEIDRFIQKWYDTCCLDSHRVDDSPSTIPNHPEFKEHRHDQSVFNILLKLEGLYNQAMPVAAVPILPSQRRSGI